ncbi:hypothetical protein YYG_03270 [Plasmodium vinckei petteri]|uniref:Fam-a protein n=1 Tax=Plasmodium vinckei petteri TaxID=138298 RepID=W7AHK5_PLAVN|nr:hypothetical protein YYG_03270 [Plasmodium vinckei petteri]
MSKFYIQIVFFLLSVSVYLSNKTLATEPAPRNAATLRSIPDKDTSDEVYKKHEHLLCTDPKEIKQAIEFKKEAVLKLIHYAIDTNYNKSHEIKKPNASTDSCKKKDKCHENDPKSDKYHDIIKVNFQIDDPNKYNKIINKLWDPDYPNSSDHLNSSDHSPKIVRVYNPNLVIIQRRINNPFFGCQKYFYALAAKVEISKDKAVIVMASGNINDHNSQNTISYKNPIIESANLFEADIDSDEDIKSGKLIKTFVNISGHLIEKKDNCVDITYVTSINGLINLTLNEPSEKP